MSECHELSNNRSCLGLWITDIRELARPEFRYLQFFAPGLWADCRSINVPIHRGDGVPSLSGTPRLALLDFCKR
jgi:hypothetical protein